MIFVTITSFADFPDHIFDSVPRNEIEDTTFMYYINDGLYGSFNCLFYDHAVVAPTLLKVRKSDVTSLLYHMNISSCRFLGKCE